jgi:beta-barrel assembly-enhancing protease
MRRNTRAPGLELNLRHGGGVLRRRRPFLAILSLGTLLVAIQICWAADRTPLKPGWDLFTPEQDIQLGQEASKKVDQQLPLLKDERVDRYLDALGKRLAAYAPGYKYPYQYRAVNDETINAFALPGGFIYINRGVIEAADNEAQLAGVMAHETSHVALRHGTSHASKANAWQVPLSILGAVTGNSLGGLLTQLGGSFTLNSILLKNSRDDENQADVMGTQILYDSGYDPRALAQFFEKIEAESKGKEAAQFFSDHPNPGNRTERVSEEVDKLGGPEPNYRTDSDDFHSIKIYVMKLPKPPKPSGK